MNNVTNEQIPSSIREVETANYDMAEYHFPLFIRAIAFLTVWLAVLWPRYLFFPIFGFGANPLTLIALLGTPVVVLFAIMQPIALGALLRLIRLNFLVVITFFFVILVRLISCYTGQQSSVSTQSFIRDLPIFFLFIMFMITFTDSHVRDRFPSLLLGLAVVQLLLAILEFSMETSIAGLLGLNAIGVGDANALAQVGTARVRDGAYRAQALFGHPIVLGQFSAALVPLAMTVFYRYSIIAKMSGILLVSLTVAGAFVSGTRSALMLMAVGIVVFFVMAIRKTRNSAFSRAGRIYFVLIVGIVGTVLFSDSFSEVVAGRTATEIGSTQTRQVQIEYSMQAIEAKPIIGYGLGNGIQYSGIINGFGQQTLDNFFISVALDTGLVGLGSFLLLSALAIVTGIAAVGRTLDIERYQVASLLAFYVVLFTGHSVQSIIDTLSFEMIVLPWLMNAGRNLMTFDMRPSS